MFSTQNVCQKVSPKKNLGHLQVLNPVIKRIELPSKKLGLFPRFWAAHYYYSKYTV